VAEREKEREGNGKGRKLNTLYCFQEAEASLPFHISPCLSVPPLDIQIYREGLETWLKW
jgi:hypothetical protein